MQNNYGSDNYDGDNYGGGDDVCFSRQGYAAIIRLTRTKALNALSYKMIKAIDLALDDFAKDDSIACVMIEGEGRAFCAGGDVVSAYHAGIAGKPFHDYFIDEYNLNAKIGRFPKPYIALLDGICMGGGAGVSIHGSCRIATENTLFAMPETAIGFFTDIGCGAFLPKMKNHFGIYLALTGNSCKWGDCLHYGLATYAIFQKDLESFKQIIIKTGDYHKAIEQYSQYVDCETALENRDFIDKSFGKASLEECVDYLLQYSNMGNLFAKTCLSTLESRSPTSLKVIWRYLVECRDLSLEQCLEIDKRIAYTMLKNHDFYEGVRAVLIDKDKNPNWQPNTLAGVSPAMVGAYFKK